MSDFLQSQENEGIALRRKIGTSHPAEAGQTDADIAEKGHLWM